LAKNLTPPPEINAGILDLGGDGEMAGEQGVEVLVGEGARER